MSCLDTPVVFLHGWGTHSDCWQPLINALAIENAQVIDLPGFGQNEDIAVCDYHSVENFILEQLPATCVLVGWSLGGMIALRLARHHPERITSLVTIASNANFVASTRWPEAMDRPTFDDFLANFEANSAATFSRFILLQSKGDINRKQVAAQLKTIQTPPESAKLQKQWYQALGLLDAIKNDEIIAQVTCPYLVLLGENDNLVPVACKHYLKNSASIDVHVLTGLGHAPHLSEPERVASRIRTFLFSGYQQRDKNAVADSFSQSAKNYDSVAKLQQHVATRLVQLTAPPTGKVADIGCGTGFCSQQISHTCEQVVGIDLSAGMVEVAKQKNITRTQFAVADMENLPMADNTFDGVISSLCFQWSENIEQLFNESYRVLKARGWLLFSTLGPKTLYELRDAWRSVNDFIHVNEFIAYDNVEQALKNAGFYIEQTYCETETMEYDTVFQLMRELKELGAHNVNKGKPSGLTTRKQLQQVEHSYQQFKCNGKLPATYDVFYFWVRK